MIARARRLTVALSQWLSMRERSFVSILKKNAQWPAVGFGLTEIPSVPGSSDGDVGSKSETMDVKNVVYAKYGIHLDGRGFTRARIAGVTRAVTAPLSNGFAGGVSVGIKTSGKKTILDGGIFQDEIALHFTIGQDAKSGLLSMLKV
jgi:hypothetical protein